MLKKVLFYSAIVLLFIGTVTCIVLKTKFENDFMMNESQKLNDLMLNLDESNAEQKAEIAKIAGDYKYRIYTYYALAFLTFTSAIILILKRKRILQEENEL